MVHFQVVNKSRELDYFARSGAYHLENTEVCLQFPIDKCHPEERVWFT